MSVVSFPFVIFPFVTISVYIVLVLLGRHVYTKKTDSEVIERLKFWLR